MFSPTAIFAIHVASAILFVALVVGLIWALIACNRARRAEVAKLQEQIDALTHQNTSWQSAANDL